MMPTTAAATDAYIYVAGVDELFADPTYQRPLDAARVRNMARDWDKRLAGILEVSDRGEETYPRYAIMDGQHRWAAARQRIQWADTDPTQPLVVNIHTGLTVADEAAMFDRLNRQRKQTGTFDHWRARLAAHDPKVEAITAAVVKHGLQVVMSPDDGTVACVSALEKIEKIGGVKLVDDTIGFIAEVWGKRRDAFDAPIVYGTALVIHYLSADLDLVRLGDAMGEITPRQLKTNAQALRDITPGATQKLVAIALMTQYNKRLGKKILVSTRTFGGIPKCSHRPGPQGAIR